RTYLIRYAADLLDLHPLPTRRSSDLLIDPARGRLVVPGGLAAGDAAFAQHYHFGLTHWVGAGPFPHIADLSPDDEVTGELPSGAVDADGFFTDPGPLTGFALPTSGVHRVPTSKTYQPELEDGTWSEVGPLRLEAKDGERPYLRFVPDAADPTVVIRAASGGEPPDLILDGLWLGILPDLAPIPLATKHDPCPVVPARIALDGAFRNVVLRHCTMDPGGEQARLDLCEGRPIPAVTLEIRGQVDRLLIDRCITGPILEATSTGDPCSAREIAICDSIVH